MAKQIADKPDNWSKVVGMPDDWDRKNIQALVETFRKTTFTIPVDNTDETITMTGDQCIKEGLKESRERHQIDGNLKGNDFGLKSKDMDMRVMTSIPQPLHKKLMEGYPTLLKDEKHLMWFIKNFPMFRVPKRI